MVSSHDTVDLVSIDYSSADNEETSRARIHSIGDLMYRAQQREGQYTPEYIAKHLGGRRSATTTVRRRGLFNDIKVLATKFALLYKRAWRNMYRDRGLNIARLCSSLFSALLFGAIYYKMGDGASTVPDRLGLLQVLTSALPIT